MCGIVGAVAKKDICPILLEGLKRLEYRGYDSAGFAVISNNEKAPSILLSTFFKDSTISLPLDLANKCIIISVSVEV